MGCRYVTSLGDLDLTFDIAVVTLSLKILSGLYLRKRKGLEVDTSWGHWLRVVGVQRHGAILIGPLTLSC